MNKQKDASAAALDAKQQQIRGYRTASEYAAAAAARIQVNENGFVDINKVVHENNELRWVFW